MSPSRALTVCSRPGCPELASGGRCDGCKREAEQARGSAYQRGYGRTHEIRFRGGVLARDVTCVMPACTEPATDADHYPLDRRELVRQGLDPDDPKHGRGLCGRHHKIETARNQPGGWNAN